MEPKLFLIFENEKILIVHLGGYFNNLEMQQSAVEAVEILSAKKLDKMLVDITKLEVLMNMSQVWVKEVWYPQAVSHGLKHIAFIVSLGFLDKNDLRKINKNSANEKVSIRFFESDEEAITWLKQVS